MKVQLKKLFHLKAVLVISLQFVYAPLAFSQVGGQFGGQGFVPQGPQATGPNIIGAALGGLSGAAQETADQAIIQARAASRVQRGEFIRTAQQLHPSQEFFGCGLPPAIGNEITNLCQNNLSGVDPVSVREDAKDAEFFMQLATDNATFYRNFLEPGQASTGPATQGTNKCIDQRRKQIMDDLAAMERAIEGLLNQYEREFQSMAALADTEMDKIKNASYLLSGNSDEIGNIDPEAVRFENFFQSPQCRQVMPLTAGKQLGENSGLRGVRDNMTPSVQKAQEVQAFDFEAAFEQKIGAIERNFRDFGLEGIQDYNSAIAGSEGSSGTLGILQSTYDLEMRRIGDEIRDETAIITGLKNDSEAIVNLPGLNEDFVGRARNLLAQSQSGETDWREEFLSSCIAGETAGSASNGGFQYVLDNLRADKNTGRARVEEYRTKVQSIMATVDMTTEEKLAAVRALDVAEQNRGGMVVGVRGAVNSSGNQTASSFLAAEISNCDTQYRRTKLITDPQSGDKISYAEAHSRARESINKIIGQLNSVTRKLRNKMGERFLNCAGITMSTVPSASDGCNASKMDMSSEKFCKTQSLSCAQNTSGCYSEIEQNIATLETERTTVANNLNVTLGAYKQSLQTNLDTLIGRLTAQGQQLKQQFPFAEDLDFNVQGLVLPELLGQMNQRFGVDLVNGGDPRMMYNMFKQMVDNDIKGALEQRRNDLNGFFDQKVAEQNAAYAREQRKWEDLASRCNANMQFIAQQAEQIDAQNAEYNRDLQDALTQMCQQPLVASVNNCDDSRLESLAQAFGQLQENGAVGFGDQNAYFQFRQQCGDIRNRFGSGRGARRQMQEQAELQFCFSFNPNNISSQIPIQQVNAINPMVGSLLQQYLAAPEGNEQNRLLTQLQETASSAGDYRLMSYIQNATFLKERSADIEAECRGGSVAGSGRSLTQCIDETKRSLPDLDDDEVANLCEQEARNNRPDRGIASNRPLVSQIVAMNGNLEDSMIGRGFGEGAGMPMCNQQMAGNRFDPRNGLGIPGMQLPNFTSQGGERLY